MKEPADRRIWLTLFRRPSFTSWSSTKTLAITATLRVILLSITLMFFCFCDGPPIPSYVFGPVIGAQIASAKSQRTGFSFAGRRTAA